MGRPVYLASQDFTVVGGSAGETHNIKVTETMKRADERRPLHLHQ